MNAIRYETFEHTADKGIYAYGTTLEELFQNAAYGMFSLMAEIDQYSPVLEKQIEVTADNRELLLKAWLDELLFFFEVERVLFVDFKLYELGENAVKGTARGVPITDQIEWQGAVVKAVTYHALRIEQISDGWKATVVFDV